MKCLRFAALVAALLAVAAPAGASDPVPFEEFQLAADPATKPIAAAPSATLVGTWYHAFGGGAWVSITIRSIAPLSGEMEGLVGNAERTAWIKFKNPFAAVNEPGGKGTKKPKAWLENGKLNIETPAGTKYSDLEVRGNALVGRLDSASVKKNPFEFKRQ